MRIDFKISLIIASICFIGGFLVVPYQLTNLQMTQPEQYKMIMDTLPLPYNALIVLSAIQLAVISFVLAYIGIKIARKTGFSFSILDAFLKKEKVKVDKAGVIQAIIFGMITAFVLVGADRFFYQYVIEEIATGITEFSFLGLITGVIYGGIFEEVMMRLLFMSLLIWLFMIIFRKNKDTLNGIFYWIAILVAAVLFAAGHLPANEMIFGELTSTIIIRCFLLNGIGGIFFGFLYWKKGFEYAVIAHMFTHIWFQIVFKPLLF